MLPANYRKIEAAASKPQIVSEQTSEADEPEQFGIELIHPEPLGEHGEQTTLPEPLGFYNTKSDVQDFDDVREFLHEAHEIERLFGDAVHKVIEEAKKQGRPIACYDEGKNLPYLEYPDGRREYEW